VEIVFSKPVASEAPTQEGEEVKTFPSSPDVKKLCVSKPSKPTKQPNSYEKQPKTGNLIFR